MKKAKFYETNIGYRILVEKYWPKKIREFRKAEDNYIKKNIRCPYALDVGCGDGRHLKLLARQCKNVYGLDNSYLMVKLAKKKLSNFKNIKLHLREAKNMPFKSNFFDCTICFFNTIGNIYGKEQITALKEMRRVTKPTGKIILTFYAKKALEHQKLFYRNIGAKVIRHDPNFVYTKEGFKSQRWSQKEIRELAKKVKLKEISIKTLNNISYLAKFQK